jgi:glucokinase
MPYALGIDFGGTKILAGVVDIESGEVCSSVFRRTVSEHGGDDIFHRLAAVAREAIVEANIALHDICAAGIGVAAQVDSAHGVIEYAPNLPNELAGAHLGARLQEALHLPVTVVNDVVAAGAGEAAFGAGRGCPDFVCIFVGTGIGGAVYQGGRLYTGATNTAGELGHMVIDYGGRICGCGGRGHLEAYASRSAIVRSILAALRQGRPSLLAKVEPNADPGDVQHSAIHDVSVNEAIEAGDELALEMVRDGARYMGAGLVSIINFYNPPRIVLGGGMVENVGVFFDLVKNATLRDALQVPRQQVEIVKAGLYSNSGVIGAAVLAGQES